MRLHCYRVVQNQRYENKYLIIMYVVEMKPKLVDFLIDDALAPPKGQEETHSQSTPEAAVSCFVEQH